VFAIERTRDIRRNMLGRRSASTQAAVRVASLRERQSYQSDLVVDLTGGLL
jgi:hypothetical protein